MVKGLPVLEGRPIGSYVPLGTGLREPIRPNVPMWLKRCECTGRPHAGTSGCSTVRRPHSLRVMPYRPRGSVVQPSQVPKHGAPTFDHPWRARRLLSFDVWSSPRYLGRWNARRQGLRSGALSKHQECNQRDNGPQERREQERRGKVQFRHEPAARPCLTLAGIDRQVRIIQRSRVRLKQRRAEHTCRNGLGKLAAKKGAACPCDTRAHGWPLRQS